MKALLFSVVFSILMLFNFNPLLADTINKINSDNNVDIDLNINKGEKSKELSKSSEDIFGDEQTFPFVAGLGKNAAH